MHEHFDYKSHKKAVDEIFDHLRVLRFLGKDNDLLEAITGVIDRLDSREKQIITHKYLTEDDIRDYEVFTKLGISVKLYEKLRSRALSKLDAVLNFTELHERVGQRISIHLNRQRAV